MGPKSRGLVSVSRQICDNRIGGPKNPWKVSKRGESLVSNSSFFTGTQPLRANNSSLSMEEKALTVCSVVRSHGKIDFIRQ